MKEFSRFERGLLALVASRPGITQKELADATGRPQSSILNAMLRLQSGRIVASDRDGRYRRYTIEGTRTNKSENPKAKKEGS